MYVALIPERPRFEEEHMTLVWCGNMPLTFQTEQADRLTQEINAALRHPANRSSIAVVMRHEFFGRRKVALLEVPFWLWAFRERAEEYNLNASKWPNWRPHISANGKGPRPVNSVVRFTHAEVRK